MTLQMTDENVKANVIHLAQMGYLPTDIAQAMINRLATKDVNIKREGEQIILPPKMSYDEAIQWLSRKKEAEQKKVAVRHEI